MGASPTVLWDWVTQYCRDPPHSIVGSLHNAMWGSSLRKMNLLANLQWYRTDQGSWIFQQKGTACREVRLDLQPVIPCQKAGGEDEDDFRRVVYA